ncbi:MAG: PLP-dependent aminotransferase family protein [Verrucomicrobiales bacterium]
MKMPQQGLYLYQQLARELSQQIVEGVYGVGDKLPSIRRLCAQKGVSVATAMQALSMLESRGMVEARPKSGYFIRRRQYDQTPKPAPSVGGLRPQFVGVSDIVARVFRQVGEEGKIPLGAGVPDAGLLPIERLSKHLAATVREEPCHLGRYGAFAGHPNYIRQLAKRFGMNGCVIPSDEIVATAGAMDSLNLAIRAVTKPGDVVAVESPCYFGILEILESLGLKALPVPSTCEGGIDLGLLAEGIEQHPVKAVALVPTFSNPNGSCLGEQKRKQLLALLSEYDLPLIEDDLYGDLQFSGARVRPVKAYDTEGRVIYCGSFSKSLTPGLRVGWIAAGRYSERVRRLKFISTVNTPIINQLAVARFLEAGAMDRHLRSFRSALETQVAQIAECALQVFPDGTAISQPKGGFFLWVQLPNGVDALDLFQLADAEGIHIAPGQIFCPYASLGNRIRLSCGHPLEGRIQAGLVRLGELVRILQKKGLKAR